MQQADRDNEQLPLAFFHKQLQIGRRPMAAGVNNNRAPAARIRDFAPDPRGVQQSRNRSGFQVRHQRVDVQYDVIPAHPARTRNENQPERKVVPLRTTEHQREMHLRRLGVNERMPTMAGPSDSGRQTEAKLPSGSVQGAASAGRCSRTSAAIAA